MDIQTWLDETVEAEALHVRAQTAQCNFSCRPEQSKPVFQERRAQKRCKSDSSLLVPQPHLHIAPPNEPDTPTKHNLDVTAGDESSSQRYVRRPRRKTRPERYEPRQNKKREKHVHHTHKGEPKKSRRTSRCKKEEKSEGGVAQSFHAKNISGDRLTLKPKEQLGIFNKGKASAIARGRGLPDLVFSEMKFLQKDKDPSEPILQQGAAKKKHKIGQIHTKEGEISAFFTCVRSARAEKDGEFLAGKTREDHATIAETDRCERDHSQKSSGVVPTIEKPTNGAYLGFRSRGPRHESTSHMSWSESNRAPDMASHRLTFSHDHNEPSTHPSMTSATSGAENIGFQPLVHPPNNVEREDANTEHILASLTIPSQRTLPIFQSHPQHMSPSRKVNLVERTTMSKVVGSVTSPSSMPPCVPGHASIEPLDSKIRVSAQVKDNEEVPCLEERSTLNDQGSTVQIEYDQTQPEQNPSSDLGRIIQHCNQTFREQRRANASCQRSHISGTSDEGTALSMQARSVPSPERRRRPIVRFSGIEMLSPITPTIAGVSLHQQQAARHRTLLPTVLKEEDFPEDSALTGQELSCRLDDIFYNEQEWEEQGGAPYYEENGEDMTESVFDVGQCRASDSFVQRLPSDNSVVAPGFWRPNRLY